MPESSDKKITEYGKKVRNTDYIRCDIQELHKAIGDRAIVFTAKYIHTENDRFATFSNIRVFDEHEGEKTKYQLTDHVNFPRRLLSRYLALSSDLHHMKFFILGTLGEYDHYGIIRGSISLLVETNIAPILRAPDNFWIWCTALNRLLVARNQYNSCLPD